MYERSVSGPVRVVPGAGAVVRYEAVTALLLGGTPLAVREIRDALQRGAAAPDALESVSAALAEGRREGIRAAAVVVSAHGNTVVLSGDLDVRATLPFGELRLNAADADGMVTHALEGFYTQIVLGAVSEGEDDPWWELSEGAVPGAGVVIDLQAAVSGPAATDSPPADAPDTVPISMIGGGMPLQPEVHDERRTEKDPDTHDEPLLKPPMPVDSPVMVPSGDDSPKPDPEPAEFEFDAVLLVDAASRDESTPREPLDAIGSADAASTSVATVKGLMCSRGHFNHPLSANCAWCGIGMAQASHVLVSGERPPLGVLVVNGQSTFTLDAGYVIGRQPGLDPSVDGVVFRELVLTDQQRGVSRVHATVRLSEWAVFVEDQGSGIGTWVLAARGAPQPARLTVGEARELRPGDRILIGPHQLTFHSHHLR